VIDHGSVIAEGTADELKDRVGGERLEVHLDEGADVERAIAALGSVANDHPVAEDGWVRVSVASRQGTIAAAVRRLDEQGVGIQDIALRRPTLDDVFITLTGRSAEDGDETAEPAEEVRA
jgi:ABC-2 type transport system ATP-binding protein